MDPIVYAVWKWNAQKTTHTQKKTKLWKAWMNESINEANVIRKSLGLLPTRWPKRNGRMTRSYCCGSGDVSVSHFIVIRRSIGQTNINAQIKNGRKTWRSRANAICRMCNWRIVGIRALHSWVRINALHNDNFNWISVGFFRWNSVGIPLQFIQFIFHFINVRVPRWSIGTATSENR